MTSPEPGADVEVLRSRLASLEEALVALSSGQADGLVVGEPGHERVLTLSGVDLPFQRIVEHLGDGAATMTRDGTVLFANNQLAGLVDAEADTLIGRLFADFLTTDSRHDFEPLLAVQPGETLRAELQMTTGDTRVLGAVTSLDLDGMPMICAVLTDVTEQRRIEGQLQREQLRAERRDEGLRVARELNDTVLQGLAATELALDLEERDRARGLLSETARHARSLITELIDGQLVPGQAVRRQASGLSGTRAGSA